MKVTINRGDLDFPSLNFSIKAGEVKELPADEETAKIILNNPDIIQVDEITKKPEADKPKGAK
jgi:hypothetical protein